MVLIRAQGLANTGESYSISCTVTESDASTPSITWMNSDGNIVSNMSGLYLQPTMTVGTSTVSVLLFNPLSVNHQDNYTCLASVGAASYTYTYPVIVSASK